MARAVRRRHATVPGVRLMLFVVLWFALWSVRNFFFALIAANQSPVTGTQTSHRRALDRCIGTGCMLAFYRWFMRIQSLHRRMLNSAPARVASVRVACCIDARCVLHQWCVLRLCAARLGEARALRWPSIGETTRT
jgi:hypothetical protein